MILSKLIKRAMKYNGLVTAYVYGPMGYGKTSYALHVGAEIYGWNKVLDYLFFEPDGALKLMKQAAKTGKRVPLIIMDDAGFWLDKTTWWEKDKVAFMKFYNLIRSVAAGIIFTTPVDELPKSLRKKIFFRIKVFPVSLDKVKNKIPNLEEVCRELEEMGCNSRLWVIARGYALETLPSFLQFVQPRFEDLFPLHYPKRIYEEYEKIRQKTVLKGIETLMTARNTEKKRGRKRKRGRKKKTK